MISLKLKILIFFLLSTVSFVVCAAINMIDDSGKALVFDAPVKRVISLSPHITELLYAAGVDKQIVGTVSYSDYPPAAQKIPVIGSFEKVDYEKILALQPDVIIYWGSGNPQNMINGIKELKLKLFNSEPKNFEDVARSIKMFGKLLGTQGVADNNARQYMDRLNALRKKYANHTKEKVRVFYQVWNQPLMTVNKTHLINDVIEFCGGENVFAALHNIAPTIDMESVIKKNPDVIISGMAKGREEWLQDWQKWPTISAVKNAHVYAIDAGLLVRQTPRILDGTQKMCEILQGIHSQVPANKSR